METQRNNVWWVFLLQGLAAILMGVMLLARPGETLIALVTLLGVYWLITGMLSLVQMFVDHSVPWIWSLIAGVVGVMAGMFVLNHPLLAALSVPAGIAVALGIQGLVIGTAEVVHGFAGGGLGSFVLGAINIIMGLLLIATPLQAMIVVPIVFGFLLLLQGIVVAVWSVRVHRFVDAVNQPAN
jgi:uncharacterized membrane protein HdeD (DUF308 family)